MTSEMTNEIIATAYCWLTERVESREGWVFSFGVPVEGPPDESWLTEAYEIGGKDWPDGSYAAYADSVRRAVEIGRLVEGVTALARATLSA